MRILHTSDWHLGHRLHDVPRVDEHQRFLEWLLDRLVAERVDALLIAGDVFDSANPPPSALRAWYDFLTSARTRCPQLDIVVIGGNHDSASRLDAPAGVLKSLGIHVIGGLISDGIVDPDRLIIPVTDDSGRVAAQIIGIPFLRRRELDVQSRLEGAVSKAMGDRALGLVTEAMARRNEDQALVLMAHLYVEGGLLSEGSERRIQLGYRESVDDTDLCSDAVAYVALGHLHRAQPAGPEHVRYCGSPIPLSIPERDYRQEVRLLEFSGAALVAQRAITVPRFVDILAIPEEHAPLDVVLDALSRLPAAETREDDPRPPPMIEVRLLLDTVQPRLRSRIDAAMDGRWGRVIRIDALTTGTDEPLADQIPRRDLRLIDPGEVFERCYIRAYAPPVPTDLARRYAELVEAVRESQ